MLIFAPLQVSGRDRWKWRPEIHDLLVYDVVGPSVADAGGAVDASAGASEAEAEVPEGSSDLVFLEDRADGACRSRHLRELENYSSHHLFDHLQRKFRLLGLFA